MVNHLSGPVHLLGDVIIGLCLPDKKTGEQISQF